MTTVLLVIILSLNCFLVAIGIVCIINSYTLLSAQKRSKGDKPKRVSDR
jgi:hypothetical protein